MIHSLFKLSHHSSTAGYLTLTGEGLQFGLSLHFLKPHRDWEGLNCKFTFEYGQDSLKKFPCRATSFLQLQCHCKYGYCHRTSRTFQTTTKKTCYSFTDPVGYSRRSPLRETSNNNIHNILLTSCHPYASLAP